MVTPSHCAFSGPACLLCQPARNLGSWHAAFSYVVGQWLGTPDSLESCENHRRLGPARGSASGGLDLQAVQSFPAVQVCSRVRNTFAEQGCRRSVHRDPGDLLGTPTFCRMGLGPKAPSYTSIAGPQTYILSARPWNVRCPPPSRPVSPAPAGSPPGTMSPAGAGTPLSAAPSQRAQKVL